MLFASVDIQDGRVVQLVQGQHLKLQYERGIEVARKFGRWFPLTIIDLDAARGVGENRELIRKIIRLFPDCRVGGGIRSVEDARWWIRMGAAQVIIGTQAIQNDKSNTAFLKELVDAIGRNRIIIALDIRGEYITTHGWQQTHSITIWEMLPLLEPFCNEFLVTYVPAEGTMQGFPQALARRIRHATGHALTLAGGIATTEQIQQLTKLGCNIQIGMALYTGKLSIADAFISSLNWQDGLVPTVVQDTSGKTLMLAYSSPESLARTINEGVMWYYSRKRKRLWKKGETSGNIQEVRYLRTDCDNDTILATVHQKGVACHTGNYTCFGPTGFSLAQLQTQIAQRLQTRPPGSYTASLTPQQVRKKLIEEAAEVALAEDHDSLRWECADLIYFLTVLMTQQGISWEEVLHELQSRSKPL